MQLIANRYSNDTDVVAGIELLNEPLMSELAGGRGATQSYYQNAYNIVRGAGNAQVVIQDGFVNPSSWNGFLTGQGTSGAIVDHHEYQVFTCSDVALSWQQHVDAVYSRAQTWATGADKFIINGEMTGAMTDCAAALVSSPTTPTIQDIELTWRNRMVMVLAPAMRVSMTTVLMLGLVPTSTSSRRGQMP